MENFSLGDTLETVSIKFDSLKEFNNWKETEELATSTRYVQHRGSKTNMDKTITTKYYCHRSGIFTTKSKGKRALKITGSCKIDQCCPSFIRTVVGLTSVEAIYCKTHIGHQNEIRFRPIPTLVQETIAGLPNDENVTHYVNAINSRHRSALQINYKITKMSNDTWSVASNSLELDYLVQQNEPCTCKLICVLCKCCVHLFSCTCYDYSIKNNMCKHIHAVRMCCIEDSNTQIDIICNPIENDEVCMKMPTVQYLAVPSTESIANKIQELYNMFVSQAGTLDDQQLQKINSSVECTLKELCKQGNNSLIKNREPVNKNAGKQLRFYSTKKPRTKAPEIRRLNNKPTLKVVNQIDNDLKCDKDTLYINIDSQIEHSYGQLDKKQ